MPLKCGALRMDFRASPSPNQNLGPLELLGGNAKRDISYKNHKQASKLAIQPWV